MADTTHMTLPLTSAPNPASRLEALKRQQFIPETRNERIEKALAALSASSRLHFTAEEWNEAARSPELEEEE